jgi:hypothetical protein
MRDILFGRDASLYEVWQAGGLVLLVCAAVGVWRLAFQFARVVDWLLFGRFPALALLRCPEHGALCAGAACCCTDRHWHKDALRTRLR